MTKIRKQHPGDVQLVRDESADPVDRASAMMRLAVDGHWEMIDLADQWLARDELELRVEAVGLLVGYWKLEDRIPITIEHLKHDPHTDVRSRAAAALVDFLNRTGKHRDRILKVLVHQLQNDTDYLVQRYAYELLLRTLLSERPIPEPPYAFDRGRDVDWSLLRPWMDSESDAHE